MEGLASWLANISWPIVSRVFASLGVGVVTYTGADTALTGALNSAKAALTGLGGETLQLLAMAGFFDAMAIMSGGILSGLAWMVMKRFAIQAGTATA